MTKCEQCQGKCCVAIIEVYSQDAIYYDADLVHEVPDMYPDRAMRVDANGVCIALIGGKCSIYDRRPTVCRNFQVDSECCNKFFTGELTAHQCKACWLAK